MFAVSIMLYTIVQEDEDDALYDSILAGRITFPEYVSPAAKDFISKVSKCAESEGRMIVRTHLDLIPCAWSLVLYYQLLVINPNKRLRLKEALRQPWLIQRSSPAKHPSPSGRMMMTKPDIGTN